MVDFLPHIKMRHVFFYERDRQLTVVKNEHITTHTAITLSADAID